MEPLVCTKPDGYSPSGYRPTYAEALGICPKHAGSIAMSVYPEKVTKCSTCANPRKECSKCDYGSVSSLCATYHTSRPLCYSCLHPMVLRKT